MTADLFLGADVGGTGLKYVVVSASGLIIIRGEVPTAPDDVGATLERLREAVSEDLSGKSAGNQVTGSTEGLGSLGHLAAVGLACAGIVDLESGSLGRSPNLPGWEGTDLTSQLHRAFGSLPVTLANDVNAALYGEFKAGAGMGCNSLVMIALGTGVGGGVLLNGQLHTGAHFGAGEIGHMVLDPRGPTCTCGGQGCLEAWAGSVGLLRSARAAASGSDSTPAFRNLVADRGSELTTRELSALADAGDMTSLDLFREVGERLGQAVGNLVNILDPDRVIIGGGVAQAGDHILKPCRQQVARQVLAETARTVPVIPAELGPHAAAVGAAWLARESRPTA
ncbi:MAG: ROK family protein [Gemmatimonadales bacterium]|nr:ROK family protein [Gemmatimonadales bacterium]